MSAPSPAQQRVVDAMRDGRVLERNHAGVWCHYETTPPFKATKVNWRVVEALAVRGVIVFENAPLPVYRLSPAYRGGEA